VLLGGERWHPVTDAGFGVSHDVPEGLREKYVLLSMLQGDAEIAGVGKVQYSPADCPTTASAKRIYIEVEE
jgi:hypothetical protein